MTDTERRAPDGFDPDVLAYYEQGKEDRRLRGEGHAGARLEFFRTQDVLRRVLPPAPARVLDVGGGSGVHAEWLAADGYAVDLIDPVPLHVEQASRLPGVTARVGEARQLDAPDATYDAVLVMGPLYHLTERADRVRALAEARRVVRPGGLVAAAVISRYAALHDNLLTGNYFNPETREMIDRSTVDGLLQAKRLFTTAYLHDPAELAPEFHEAGLGEVVLRGLEGAAWLIREVDDHLEHPERRAVVLDALRAVETAPSLLGVSGHILTTSVRLTESAAAGG
ncbi:class I SAM-dependent methyltransferase [Streptomyces sp. A7024]|uniref:Class I SAM-dependent methyltransferase n=1 Tax=Streptomyces coryli TaxID=1128680 RepID=A0A6G4UB35_9ACTN|nr:class I SAM-dependent methyltransferase [Streptomyces coryli]NGN69353.1 class I SAM-dependent methyltransferase [Streptomyces coryli]